MEFGKRGMVATMSGDDRGEYHGWKSEFLSKYAPPPLSTLFYKQDLGHAVSIYLDTIFFASIEHQRV